MTALCECGCGGPAPIAPRTYRRFGHVKGQPLRFIRGHNARSSPVEYVEEDRGFETPCWIWQRATQSNGYGVVAVDGRTRRAHRHYYEQANGPIPAGLDIDHLCRQRACVNPDHLEPVTRSENLRRGWAARQAVAA